MVISIVSLLKFFQCQVSMNLTSINSLIAIASVGRNYYYIYLTNEDAEYIERLGRFSKATQLMSNGAGTQSQAVWPERLCSAKLCC